MSPIWNVKKQNADVQICAAFLKKGVWNCLYACEYVRNKPIHMHNESLPLCGKFSGFYQMFLAATGHGGKRSMQ